MKPYYTSYRPKAFQGCSYLQPKFGRSFCAMDPPIAGKVYHTVVDVVQCMDDTLMSVWDLSQQQMTVLQGARLMTQHRYSCYDLQVDTDLGLLHVTKDSWITQVTPTDAFSPNVIELCAGSGSMGVGASFVGAQVLAAMEINPLALRHLRANRHGQVLAGDVTCMADVRCLHQMINQHKFSVFCGFPCQPYSSQGMLNRGADPRALTFKGLIRAIFMLQAQAAVLECVEGAALDGDVREGVEWLCQHLQWQAAETVIDLAQQWCTRRKRWWAVLAPAGWTLSLPSWPTIARFDRVCRVLPSMGEWSLAEEEDLLLTPMELAAYSNPAYGNDERLLQPHHVCPTMLHSYSSALTSCPCGCRSTGFAPTSLANKGLRGFFVMSAIWDAPRFVHHKEAAILHTLPSTVQFVGTPRENLALLGQLAAPLQALWAYTHLLNAAAQQFGLQRLQPLEVLEKYQAEILRQHRDSFPFAIPRVPVQLTLQAVDGQILHILASDRPTVAELLHAERITLEPSTLVRGFINDIPASQHQLIPSTTQLELRAQERRAFLELAGSWLMIGFAHGAELEVSFIRPGDFLFQALDDCGYEHVRFAVTLDGKILGRDYRLWTSMRLFVITPSSFPTLGFPSPMEEDADIPRGAQFRAAGDSCASGLDDISMLAACQQILKCLVLDDVSPLLITPLLADRLCAGEDVASRSIHFLSDHLDSNHIIVPLALQGHWVLLWGQRLGQGLLWTCFDGLRTEPLDGVRRVVVTLTHHFGLDFHGLWARQYVVQQHPHTCGVVALAHLSLALGFMGNFTDSNLLLLHQWLRRHNSPNGTLMGSGPDAVAQQLAELLVTKGVPPTLSRDRAAAAVRTLGKDDVTLALKSSNPWAALKKSASRPGHAFKFVQHQELMAVVETKAKEKHSVGLQNKKQKKTHKSGPSKPAELVIDPQLVQLPAEYFKDEEGDCLRQITLAEVTVDACGIAVCSVADAQPFLQDGATMSTYALGLLVTGVIPPEMAPDANLSSMVFPGIYAGTGEPMLINGTLLSLGDLAINRHAPKALGKELEVVATNVVKVQVFRDELLCVSWDVFRLAPAKTIIQNAPALQLCKSEQPCGTSCPFFHAPVDTDVTQVVNEIWSRRFQSVQGKSVDEDRAEVFQVYFRITSTALGLVLATMLQGVYFEPRGEERGPDPEYAIVWLPGADRQTALHRMRTCTSSVALVRLGHRYGIRVAQANEQSAHELLRPDVAFVKVDIQKTFRLHPLPFGLQRSAIEALLKEWEWTARPLQPAKGSHQGGAWDVGANTDPPAVLFCAFGKDVMVTPLKQKETKETKPQVMASRKTQQHMVHHAKSSSSSSSGGDPWWQSGSPSASDPWVNWQGPPGLTLQPQPAAQPGAKRIEAVAATMKAEVTAAVQKDFQGVGSAAFKQYAEEQNQRVLKLETGLQELTAQGKQFKSMFEQVGQQVARQDANMQQLNTEVKSVQQEVRTTAADVDRSFKSLQATFASELDAKLSSQFDRFESLLAKKHRESWLGHDGSWSESTRKPGRWYGLIWCIWVLLCILDLSAFMVVFGTPFARFYQHNAAVSTSDADRDLGSGALLNRPWLLGICSTTSSFELTAQMSTLVPLGSLRVGEANNPGPVQPSWLRIGTSNPSGLRQKELHAIELGAGIWSFSETQLSSFTQQTCTRQLQCLAKQVNRQVRVLHGAAAPPRSRSSWAGTWTGVSVVSDFACRSLTLPFKDDEFQTGRILASQHLVSGAPIQMVSVYGYCKGPTWPEARQLNQRLLHTVTEHFVYGGNGVRVILGDFNEIESEGHHFQTWKRLGWRSVQSYAAETWGHQVVASSTGDRDIDQVWLSPEALSLLRAVEVHEIFSGHRTVVAALDIEQHAQMILKWPLPSPIPWHLVHDSWPARTANTSDRECSTEWFQHWASDFEASLDGQVKGQPRNSLQPNQRGRGATVAPKPHLQQPPLARPSREGEVTLRSDLVGTAVRTWFKQLRRLQSLRHAIRAASPALSAELYRAEVWAAIKRSHGFDPDFATWWSQSRQHDHPQAPCVLPAGLPSVDQIDGIFYSFKACFESFESWHLRQKTKLMRAKHEHTLDTLHVELRDCCKEQVDLFVHEHDYAILAVDHESSRVQLDSVVPGGGFSIWRHSDDSCTVESIDGDLCCIRSQEPLEPLDRLSQTRLVSSLDEVHAELCQLWDSRWNAASDLNEADWKRLMDFTKAFVPSIDMEVEPITLPVWKRALRRYRPRAAVGSDGFSHHDLLRMPDTWSQQLLDLLHLIEQGSHQWPRQMLHGRVISLAKRARPTLPDHFRPVVIFSLIYRTWSGIRARSLIRSLAPLLDRFLAFGFLPGKETAMYWVGLQADLEQQVMAQGTLFGFSTDLQKAFNNIPRPQTKFLAKHLGVPDIVLNPWFGFLEGCQRSFVVRNVHSDSLSSSVGFPEGDALSVFAMVQLDLCWHCYLQAFHPAVQSWSFVDNLSITACAAGELAEALVGTTTFFQLWNLKLDDSKTFTWSTSKTGKAYLKLLGRQTVDTAAELGGIMSYDCRRRVGAQLLRATSLEAKWTKLKLSLAPLRQKLQCLPLTFWAKALHGVANAPLTLAQLGNLRTKALKSLRLSHAGVNPMLRLTLSGCATADPGYFQLKTVVMTFKRVACKMPDLQMRLLHCVTHFTGLKRHGPCHALLEQLSQIAWRLEPPWIQDHDGLWYHFFEMDDKLLVDLLWDAWLQFVAQQVRVRSSMCSLSGLDADLVLDGASDLTALERSLVASLQCGAFMAAAVQQHFDVSKQPICACCGVEDTQAHWLSCQRFAHLRTADDMPVEFPDSGTALATHLLPSRNPHVSWLKRFFHAIPLDLSFLSQPSEGCQHLFTDGSFTSFGGRHHGLAAWGIYNCSSGQPVMASHLSGVMQSIDRAETFAVLGALEWTQSFGCQTHLWVDSRFVVDGYHFLCQHRCVPLHWANRDLWMAILDLVDRLVMIPGCTWVPSHLDGALCDCPFADWVRFGNNNADRIAGEFNFQRPAIFWTKLRQSLGWMQLHRSQINWLRGFYFRLADFRKELTIAAAPISEPEPLAEQLERLVALVPVDWLHFVSNHNFGPRALPMAFYQFVMQWLIDFEGSGSDVFEVSFLELVFAMVAVQPIPFPRWVAQSGSWCVQPIHLDLQRPTVAALMNFVRQAIGDLAGLFDLEDRLVKTCQKAHLGVFKPMGGIKLFVSDHWHSIQDLVLSFCHKQCFFREFSHPSQPNCKWGHFLNHGWHLVAWVFHSQMC